MCVHECVCVCVSVCISVSECVCEREKEKVIHVCVCVLYVSVGPRHVCVPTCTNWYCDSAALSLVFIPQYAVIIVVIIILEIIFGVFVITSYIRLVSS